MAHAGDDTVIDHHHFVILVVIDVAELLLDFVFLVPGVRAGGIETARSDLRANEIRQALGVIERFFGDLLQDLFQLGRTRRRNHRWRGRRRDRRGDGKTRAGGDQLPQRRERLRSRAQALQIFHGAGIQTIGQFEAPHH